MLEAIRVVAPARAALPWDAPRQMAHIKALFNVTEKRPAPAKRKPHPGHAGRRHSHV
jgi:hypothetical protein